MWDLGKLWTQHLTCCDPRGELLFANYSHKIPSIHLLPLAQVILVPEPNTMVGKVTKQMASPEGWCSYT